MPGGFEPGIVVDNHDPENLGRILVRLPLWEHQGKGQAIWARLIAPFAGPEQGFFFAPEIDDEVVVGFMHGDYRHGFVLGSVWNHTAPPPEQDPQRKMIRTRGGAEVVIDDADGDETIAVRNINGTGMTISNGGGDSLRLQCGNASIVLEQGRITLQAGAVELDADSIKQDASIVQLEAGMVRASGVVQSETLIANTVAASQYTPGAGNIL